MASIQVKPLVGAAGGSAVYAMSQGGMDVFKTGSFPFAIGAAVAGSAAFDFIPQIKSTISQFTSITDDRMLRAIVVATVSIAVMKYHGGVNNMGLAGYSLGAAAGSYLLNM